jgi:hypothetical protein
MRLQFLKFQAIVFEKAFIEFLEANVIRLNFKEAIVFASRNAIIYIRLRGSAITSKIFSDIDEAKL